MQRCLVILSQQDQAEVLLNMAAQFLARVNGNRMDVLAAREPPTQVLGNMGLTDESAAVLRENQREWADSLHAIFHRWLAEEYGSGAERLNKVEVNWLDPEITVDRIISGYGKDADLLIMSFPDSRDSDQKKLATRSAIFQTGRPVLFVPPFWDRPSGDHILMAWKDTDGCRKAFASARVLLAQAKQVDVLQMPDSPMPMDILPGITPERVELKPSDDASKAAQSILDEVDARRADLLVIGGYQHNMLYNRLMGSATDYILAHPDVPVFLQH